MKLEFIDSRFNGRQPVKAVFARYAESGNIGIELLCDDEESKGQPWCVATVNVPGYRTEEDEVAIKTYSENEGLDTLLMLAGIIEKTPVRYIKSGFVQIPVYRLTKEAQKVAAGENDKPADDSEFDAERKWQQLCREQRWNVETQVILLEGFLRDKGLFGEFAAVAEKAAEEENRGCEACAN